MYHIVNSVYIKHNYIYYIDIYYISNIFDIFYIGNRLKSSRALACALTLFRAGLLNAASLRPICLEERFERRELAGQLAAHDLPLGARKKAFPSISKHFQAFRSIEKH